MSVASIVFAALLAAVPSVAKAPAKAKAPPQPTRFERMMDAMLPKEKRAAAEKMFAPVAEKYAPVANRFLSELRAAPNKREVIMKYMPQAEAALAEARAMKVEPAHAAEKEEYLKKAEAFITVIRFTAETMGK